MEYELYFLNNIHDSMETVNVELDPFFSLFSEGYIDEVSMKHNIEFSKLLGIAY